MKIIKDNIKAMAAKGPAGGQDLTMELKEVLDNYQLLCNRMRGKCHTLEVLIMITKMFILLTFMLYLFYFLLQVLV